MGICFTFVNAMILWFVDVCVFLCAIRVGVILIMPLHKVILFKVIKVITHSWLMVSGCRHCNAR